MFCNFNFIELHNHFGSLTLILCKNTVCTCFYLGLIFFLDFPQLSQSVKIIFIGHIQFYCIVHVQSDPELLVPLMKMSELYFMLKIWENNILLSLYNYFIFIEYDYKQSI